MTFKVDVITLLWLCIKDETGTNMINLCGRSSESCNIGRHARVFQDLVYNDTYKGTHFVDVRVTRGKASIRLPIKSSLKVLTYFFRTNTLINKTRVKFAKELSLS